MKKIMIIMLLSISAFSVQAESGVESLSPELRSLLGKEMQSLQKGMQAILPAYVSGNTHEIVRIAQNIKNSYVMKQSITKEQKHELMEKLPKSFLKLDQKFHQYAGMLAHVAEENHTELIGFYYSKLSETCLSCHSEYATHKFPALKPSKMENGHHH